MHMSEYLVLQALSWKSHFLITEYKALHSLLSQVLALPVIIYRHDTQISHRETNGGLFSFPSG